MVYNNDMANYLLVECKAPSVNVTQATFRQIANYNLPLRVPYLLVTNGVVNYCCRMNYKEESFEFVNEVPVY